MKTLRRASAVLLILLGGTPAWSAPEPGPLAAFHGNFRGRTSVFVSGTLYQGPGHLKVTGPRSGNSGVLTTRGSVISMGVPYDMGNVYRLASKRFTVEKPAPSIIETPSVNGRLHASSSTIRGGGPVDAAVYLTFKATLKRSPRSARLTLEHRLWSNGVEIVRLIQTGTRRLRASELD